MAKFVFVYHGGGGMAQTQEERDALMAEWGGWFQELGSAVTDMGNPIGASKTVSSSGASDGGGEGAASGYTLIEAADLDAAAKLAEGCPGIRSGGSVEVGEAIVM